MEQHSQRPLDTFLFDKELRVSILAAGHFEKPEIRAIGPTVDAGLEKMEEIPRPALQSGMHDLLGSSGMDGLFEEG
jgi:hypothetical protein